MPDFFYRRNLKKAIDDLGEVSVREEFKMLAEVARKLETGDITLSETIEKGKKETAQILFVIVPICVVVVAVMYLFFVRFNLR
jgi:hypothetical protein